MQEVRTILITCGSFALTAMVIGNAYFQKKQFYPSVVYLTKSNPSMAVLYVQAFVFVVLMGKLFRKIFFGQLRAAEMEHLIERSWYAVTETCLAFTVFRDDFSPKFVASFTFLLFLKCFHWLADDRVDYMERSPVISFLFHIRVLSLLSVLSVLDIYFVNHAYYSTLTKGASVQLVFGFEYAVLLTIVMMALMKYILHSIDLQSENPWENKAVYLLYSELILGFLKMILYLVFMVIMIKIHTFPLFAIRPMYLSIRAFKKSLHDVIMSRRAIRQMNTLYPDVSPEELASSDNVCIICREEMVAGCKKLPCGHIFHTSCLRSWFQRQQTCPTCRMEVLQMPQPRPTPPTPQQNPVQQQPQQMPNIFGQGFPPMWPPQFPQMPGMPPPGVMPQQPGVMPQQPGVMPQQPGATGQQPGTTTTTQAGTIPQQSAATTQQQVPSSSTTQQSTTTTTPSSSAAGSTPTTFIGSQPFVQNPFMPPMFMQNSFPRPPLNLSSLSEDDLRLLEGTERENVEARIQWLMDIQTLLDGAVMLMNQYNQVAANTNIPIIRSSQSDLQQKKSSSPTKTKSKTDTSSSQADSERPKINQNDISGLEEATGYTAPMDEPIPAWEDPRTEEHTDEMDEVRRRRLERFLSDNSTKSEDSDHNKHSNIHTD